MFIFTFNLQFIPANCIAPVPNTQWILAWVLLFYRLKRIKLKRLKIDNLICYWVKARKYSYCICWWTSWAKIEKTQHLSLCFFKFRVMEGPNSNSSCLYNDWVLGPFSFLYFWNVQSTKKYSIFHSIISQSKGVFYLFIFLYC